MGFRWNALLFSIVIVFIAYLLNMNLEVVNINMLLFHPEHAHYSSDDFINSPAYRLFEGWYYKIASQELQLAVIPGAYHNTEENYAFIMFVTPDYVIEYRYPIESYIVSNSYTEEFNLRIGPNNFTRSSLSLYLLLNRSWTIQPPKWSKKKKAGLIGTIKFNLTFDEQDIGFPISLLQLGAMGYYGHIPFLECYHGILAMNYIVYGNIEIGGKTLYKYSKDDTDNTNNKIIAHGYLEKDWGTNFPQTWVWIQANHFRDDQNVSLTLALARLPIIGDSTLTKPGFLGGLYLNNTLQVIGTYNWCNVDEFDIIDDDKYRKIFVTISNFWRTQKLRVIATIPNAYKLPRMFATKIHPHLLVPSSDGEMHPVLMEWVNATVWMRFDDSSQDLSFESSSFPATVECHGEDNMQYMKHNFGS